MMLSELNPVALAALPVQAFKDHLRLGTGFADDGAEDALAEAYLRAALAAIEARTGKAVLARDFRLELTGWRDDRAQALPVAPVSGIDAVTLTDAEGQETAIDPARWRLVADRHRPQIAATGAILPQVPTSGSVAVDFTAGFGATWDAVPDDLAQAVMLLAAQYYEGRTGAGSGLPLQVEALVARWMPVRVTAGGRL